MSVQSAGAEASTPGLTAMTVDDIVSALRHALGSSGPTAANQGLLSGDRTASVNRVLVCPSASVEVLREAAATPGTMVVTRGHPFYVHDTTYWSNGVDAALRKAGDPVLAGKQAIVDQARLPIYRLSAEWDAKHPKGQAEALAETLGWRAGESGGGRKVICDIAAATLEPLARRIAQRLDAGHLRITGAPGARIRRVAILPEFVTAAEARDVVETEPAVDLLICGEATEWEAAIYLKDSLDMRRAPISVIYAGHQPTLEPGVRRMHRWLEALLAPLPVTCRDTARPVRSTREPR